MGIRLSFAGCRRHGSGHLTRAERTALIAALKQFSVDPSEETIADYHRINKALWEKLERVSLRATG